MCACLAELVGPTGRVFGVEHVEELTNLATNNLAACGGGYQNIELLSTIPFANPSLANRVYRSREAGDGFAGWEEGGPYDAIYVGAAAETLPEALIQQLRPGGRMIVPGASVCTSPCLPDVLV